MRHRNPPVVRRGQRDQRGRSGYRRSNASRACRRAAVAACRTWQPHRCEAPAFASGRRRL